MIDEDDPEGPPASADADAATGVVVVVVVGIAAAVVAGAQGAMFVGCFQALWVFPFVVVTWGTRRKSMAAGGLIGAGMVFLANIIGCATLAPLDFK